MRSGVWYDLSDSMLKYWDGSAFQPVSAGGGIPPTLLDVKGDLIVASADNTAARLAAGSDGQVLTADSSQATGLKWATPSSGGAGYTVVDVAASTSTTTLDLSTGNVFVVTLSANTSLAFSNEPATGAILIIIRQDGTGSRSVTWPASVKWPAGTAPTITGTANKQDTYRLDHLASGGPWYGATLAQNEAAPSGGGGGFTPTSTGLLAWWDTAALAGANGSAVSSLADSSGNSRTMAQATSGKQPIIQTVSGRKILRYTNASAQEMRTAAPVTTSVTDTAIFIVCSGSSTSSGRMPYSAGVNTAYAILTSSGNTAGKLGVLKAGLAWADSAVNTPSSLVILLLTISGGVMALYRNGGAPIATDNDAGLSVPATASVLGGDGSSRYLDGDHGDAIVYSPCPSNSDLNANGSGLATKWGLTWSTI